MAAEDLYLMLLTSAHAPNASTQQFISDVSANEIVDSAGNYVAGGVQLAGKEGKYHTANAFVDASDVAIGPGSTMTYRYGVVYRNTGTPASSRILRQIDFKVDQIIANGRSTIQWNQLGIIYYE